MSKLPVLCLSLLIVVGPRSASADAAAEALFRAGRDALKQGSLDEACARFEESHRLEPAVGTLLNLALCEERRGRLARAWELFTRVASDLPSSDARVALAREHASVLAGRVPTLVLRAGADRDRLEFSLDGRRLFSASLDLPLPLDPGPHVVEVHVRGELVERREIDVVESRQYALDFRLPILASPLQSAPASPTPPPKTAPESRALRGARVSPEGLASSSHRSLGVVVVGTASSFLVIGGLTGLAALRAEDVVANECDIQKRCSREGVDAASRGKSMSLASTTAFIFGFAGMGAGIYLLLTDGGGQSAHSPRRSASTAFAIEPDGLKLSF
jgi:hypothetical protein